MTHGDSKRHNWQIDIVWRPYGDALRPSAFCAFYFSYCVEPRIVLPSLCVYNLLLRNTEIRVLTRFGVMNKESKFIAAHRPPLCSSAYRAANFYIDDL